MLYPLTKYPAGLGSTVSIRQVVQLLREMGVADNNAPDPKWWFGSVVRMLL